MKNKYIQELDNIKVDSSFKQAMIEKMENQTKPKFELSPLFMKATLVCTCACLIFISIFTYKTYQDTQVLKQQLASATKQIDKLYSQLYRKDLDKFMVRNQTVDEEVKYAYTSPYIYGGMGSGDTYFPAMDYSQINTKDYITVDESNQFQQVPVGIPYNHKFTIKEKKEIINNLINCFNIKEYDTYLNNEYITIISNEYSIEVKNDLISITNKVKDEVENREIFINDFIESNPILFKKEYDIENYDSSTIRYYSVLYEKTDDQLLAKANANDKIKIEISFNNNIYMRIIYDDCHSAKYYPVLSYQQALDQINKGYFEEGMKEYTDINKIYSCYLVYMYDMDGNVFLPYYKFYTGVYNLDLAEKNGFIVEDKEYVLSVLVPAISEDYIVRK